MRGRRLLLMFGGDDPSPVMRGIEGLWLMDEGSGVTAADSGGGGHDANVGADGYSPGWVTEGILFDGDYLDIIGWTPTLSSGYTISCVCQWILGTLEESRPGIFAMCDGADRAAVRLNADSSLEFGMQPGTTNYERVYHNRKDTDAYVDIGATGSANDGLWHVITIVHNGTQVTDYRDGTATGDSPLALAAISSSVANSVIGRAAGGDLFEGKMGILKINNVVLSDAELASDLAYFKSVLGGRGVTLPFEPSALPGSRVTCVYDENIVWNSGGGLDGWGV